MNKNPTPLKAISLFSSAGIGELGLEASGLQILAANELIPNRCSLYRQNYPQTQLFEGDIWEKRSELTNFVSNKLGHKEELFLAYATPPCQGMSTNGYGKLKSELAAGRRAEVDERNLLVIPAMSVIASLRPRWVMFENVPGMRNTEIEAEGETLGILEFILNSLGSEYEGGGEVLSCSDFGIPQLRRRLISIYTRDPAGKAYFRANGGSFFNKDDCSQPISLLDAIGDFPALAATRGENARTDFHPFHYVNEMQEEKFWWIKNTPEGETAFNNQCVNADCGYQKNPRHFDLKEDGKWVASKTTPIYCESCGDLLPRPTMVDKKTGERRLIRGFHSAYRRMDGSKPSRTLTRNFPFEASDNKIHPTQNRTLSIYEALVIQTIADYDYSWEIDGRTASRSLIADAIGESVPPRLIEKIATKIIQISCGAERLASQIDLFDTAPYS